MKKMTIYTTSMCPYCIKAKQLFQSLDIVYDEVDVVADAEARQQASEKAGGYMTVPMIFVGDEFLGGYDDVAKLHTEGKLLEKVRE